MQVDIKLRISAIDITSPGTTGGVRAKEIDMSVIGFTGTRNGMTNVQMGTLDSLLRDMQPEVFHHGDCVGADAEAATITDLLGWGIRVVCHPPIDEKDRAFTRADETREPKTYFARNRDIVDECDLLIGASFGPTEHSSGGTWYTIRYAQKVGKPVIVIWPDGTTEQR